MPRVIETKGLTNLIDVGAFNAFQQQLAMAEPSDIGATIATVIESDRPELRIPFLWYPPRVREFVGERRITELHGEMLTLRDKVYESTVAVPRAIVEDQQVRMVEMRVGELATEYMRFRHEEVVKVLLNGTALNSFDGVALLHASARGAINANITNVALDHAALQNGIAAMALYTEPIENRPLGMRPTHLLVGPKLEWTAKQLTQSQTIVVAGDTNRTLGSANTLYNTLEVVVSPYITDSRWYLIAGGMNAFRPVIRMDRNLAMEFAARTSPDHDNTFHRDSYEWGIRVRHGFGAGAWYAVYASVP